MSADGVFGNVLKIKPPLVFTKQNAHEVVLKLRQACVDLDQYESEIERLNAVLLSSFEPGQRAARDYASTLMANQCDQIVT